MSKIFNEQSSCSQIVRQNINLQKYFFGLANLLNSLLNEKYKGSPIRFLNLEFNTPQTFTSDEGLEPPGWGIIYDGVLRHVDVLNLTNFQNLLSADNPCYFGKKLVIILMVLQKSMGILI